MRRRNSRRELKSSVITPSEDSGNQGFTKLSCILNCYQKITPLLQHCWIWQGKILGFNKSALSPRFLIILRRCISRSG